MVNVVTELDNDSGFAMYKLRSEYCGGSVAAFGYSKNKNIGMAELKHRIVNPPVFLLLVILDASYSTENKIS
jgi:hypothetical protein